MTSTKKITRLVLISSLVVLQSSFSGIGVFASTATPPLTKCHIEVHNAHLSTYIRKTQSRVAVKVNADSKCDKSIQDLTLTVQIYKVGRLWDHQVARKTIVFSGLINANRIIKNKETFIYCKNNSESRYYGIAFARATISGKTMRTLNVISEKSVPLPCGT